LIIALVVLVLVAIGIVVRLLIAEMAKPAQGQAKTIRKVVPASTVGTTSRAPMGAVGAGAAAGGTMVAASGGGVAYSSGGVAVLDAPVTARDRRKMRMRDVVERGEGVRISPWRRMRSGVSLMVLVAVLGLASAAVVGGIVLLIGLALEQAIN
jgi:hypothetical protein